MTPGWNSAAPGSFKRATWRENSGDAFDITFTGTLPTPVLPLAVVSNAYQVVSLQTPNVATIDDILGIDIEDHLNEHKQFDVNVLAPSGFTEYQIVVTGSGTHVHTVWMPSAPPSVPVGSAVLIFSPSS